MLKSPDSQAWNTVRCLSVQLRTSMRELGRDATQPWKAERRRCAEQHAQGISPQVLSSRCGAIACAVRGRRGHSAALWYREGEKKEKWMKPSPGAIQHGRDDERPLRVRRFACFGRFL